MEHGFFICGMKEFVILFMASSFYVFSTKRHRLRSIVANSRVMFEVFIFGQIVIFEGLNSVDM